MEFLVLLGKCRILDQILTAHVVSISAVKKSNYTLLLEQQLNRYPAIQVLDQDEDFPDWCAGKNSALTRGDLSSIYIAMQEPASSLVISDEDWFLEPVAKEYSVACLSENEFLLRTIADQRLIQLYNLFKTAS